jgi:hypothetical protein
MELLKDLPNDKTWLDGVMERLKEREPAIYNYMIAKANEQLIEMKAQNFCPRCGKRTPDLTTIHTCTPPRGLEMT